MRLRSLAWLIASAIILVAVVSGFFLVRRGFSARDEPSAIEKFVARRVRGLAAPRRARELQNPIALTPEMLADARGHFADHCAICHGNDGSGNTTIGRNLYPKAPDMRLDDTQRLTDGELYYIIQDGIRMTGMPAWGKEGDENDEDSWKLVHLIRHLHELTPAQLKDMEGMNPKSPAEIEEERRDQEFLRGGAEPAAPDTTKPTAPHHKH
ncbi:MAG: c-type cytochrome [Acidobacteria bacterium]|nr:c-type cytochrome [Acidobacteriota bacterium]